MIEIDADHADRWLPLVRPHLPEVYTQAEEYTTPELAEGLIREGYLKLAAIHEAEELLGFGVSTVYVEPSGYRWMVDVHSYILPAARRRGLWRQYQDWLGNAAKRLGCGGIQTAIKWDDQDMPLAYARYGYEPMLSIWKRRI